MLSVRSKMIEKATSDLVLMTNQDSSSSNQIDILVCTDNFGVNIFLEKIFSERILVRNFKEFLTISMKIKYFVMVLETHQDFLKSFKNLPLNSFDVHGHYIIVFTNHKPEVNESFIFGKVWEKSLYNVNILIRTDDDFKLTTFFPFTMNNCNDTQPKLINRFVNGTWRRREFFPEKFLNFQKCPIKIGTPEAPSTYSKINHDNGTVDYVGSDAEIVKVLAKLMNFEAKVNHSGKRDDWGEVFNNGSSTGVIEQLITGDSDMIMGYFIDPRRSKFMTNSDVYFFIPIIVFIPPGAPYTSFENLFRPFSLILWIVVVTVISCACLFIFISKLQTKMIQDWIFENDVKNSYYNLLMIVVGGSIAKLPKKNFPRMLIMTFVIFCLVMRTLYQSRMFDYLQAGDNKRMVSSVQEMAERKFDFYLFIQPDDPLASVLSYPKE